MHKWMLMMAVVLLAGCSPRPTPPASQAVSPAAAAPVLATTGTETQALANLSSASGSIVSGRVQLNAEQGGVRVSGTIGGLVRNGAHSLQVHEIGDCSAADASSAGAYFDPRARAGLSEPLLNSRDRIIADGRGVAQVDLLIADVVLGGGAINDIADRALLVQGATPGAFSARVACGVIRTVRENP